MNHDEHLLVLLTSAYKSADRTRVGDTSIHVSDLIDFCPREFWLCKNHDRSYHPQRYHSMAEKYTHDMGHAIQKIQVRRLMSQQVLFGSWRCRHCNDMTYGFQDDKAVCQQCKCKALRYEDLGVEWRIQVNAKPKYQIVIVGHMDFVVAVNEDFGFIVDAKSIKAEDFDGLKPSPEGEPSLKYKRQVQLYMHLPTKKDAKLVGKPRDERAAQFTLDRNHAVICYAVKGQRPAPYKSYLVEQDVEFCRGIDAKLMGLKKALEINKCPKQICSSPANLMAKACSVRDICFDQQIGK